MAITMSQFGPHGRLGNQLFQWQFLAALAKRMNTELVLPKWQYADVFENPPKEGSLPGATKIEEPHYEYSPEPYKNLDPVKDYDLTGYWQHEQYFDPEITIKFREDFKTSIQDKFYFELAKPTIAIGIRRTDYNKLPHVYYQLPVHYFITALTHNFPDWRNYNLIFITDDKDYCRLHFGCLKNAFFPDVKDAEGMCLMSLCSNIIMANSTYYWWAARLGCPGKVIQPNYLFAGKLLEQYGDINFYTSQEDDPRYLKHEACKIDLKDMTFTIPVKYDSKDRLDNLNICVGQILQYFDTNIIICEQGGEMMKADGCEYMKFDGDKFHRTKMLNEMARAATTPYIANWDCDIVIPPMQLLEAVNRLRSGAEMVYPYDGIFHRVRIKDKPRMTDDIGVFGSDPPDGTQSFGGAVMWNKQSFMQIGMENEYMISFGPEDVERMERAVKLGVRLERQYGNLYHFAHWCGPDSSVSNPLFKANRAVLEAQRTMSKEQLLEYIHSWPWFSPYTASYYETITEDATKSRDEVFRILGIASDAFIVDCGCGVGAWGVDLSNYIGVDWQVPRDKVLVHIYEEWDLRNQKPPEWSGKFEYVLNLEVAEHIEERYADVLIDNLCSLGDTIIFSAAIPYQGGNNHVNEQWQTYWEKKFNERGYYGVINSEIRNNKNVCLWYRQNIVIYIKGGRASIVTDFVLPEYYEQIVKNLKA